MTPEPYGSVTEYLVSLGLRLAVWCLILGGIGITYYLATGATSLKEHFWRDVEALAKPSDVLLV